MTWVNTFSRLASLIIVLPLVLRHFSPGDIALYYLFASIVSLQLMTGAGFVPTFARFVTYVLAGAREADLPGIRRGEATVAGTDIDPELAARMLVTMRRVFGLLAVGSIPLVGIIGTCLLLKPVQASSMPAHSWLAWTIIVSVTPVVLFASQYDALLQGANKVALDQRWSALFVICGSVAGLVVLLLGGGLLSLIAVNQAWQLVSFLRLRFLATQVRASIPSDPALRTYSAEVFRAIWPSSWKSFVGVLASGGVVAISGLLLAQFFSGAALAQFLFGLRILDMISNFSRAPVYSKLPVFNRLRVQDRVGDLRSAAQRSMQLSYLVYLGLFALAPVGAAILLPLIKSNISFPELRLWGFLGVAGLTERYGAMHLQVYSTTNRIVWHWLNGCTGLVWLGGMVLLIPRFGFLAYPLAMLGANLGFYAWISARLSLRSLRVRFWEFEKCGLLPAAATMSVIEIVFYLHASGRI